MAADERLFAAIAAAWAAPLHPRAPESGGDRTTPVLIVGMPRCGSTLVERILAAHSHVSAAGESNALPALVASLDARHGCRFPQWIGEPAEAGWADVGERYSEALRGAAGTAAVVTDKMLDNFKYLGLVSAAVPGVRLVHVARSPLDTCLSCFAQYFSSSIPYSYDLAELGRYYRAYHDLMAHWRGVLPEGAFLEVEYEALVGAPAEQARRIIDYCGLPWEAGCLEFQRSAARVETASVAQVRQGIHQRAIGGWKTYARFLQPLVDALGERAR